MGDASIKTCMEKYPHRGFSKQPHYYPVGDYLTYFADERRCFAIRVNELLTVYVSTADSSLVGCKVKGIALVMEQWEKLHVRVSDLDLTLRLFFFSVAAITEETETREQVFQYASQLPAIKIPREVLEKKAA